MSKQAHDIGVQKRQKGQKPKSRIKLKRERFKRRHPGPRSAWPEWVLEGEEDDTSRM
jgi:hypothetical protein